MRIGGLESRGREAGLRGGDAVIHLRAVHCRQRHGLAGDHLLQVVRHIVVADAIVRGEICRDLSLRSHAVDIGVHVSRGARHNTGRDVIASHKTRDRVTVGRGRVVAHKLSSIVNLGGIQLDGQRGSGNRQGAIDRVNAVVVCLHTSRISIFKCIFNRIHVDNGSKIAVGRSLAAHKTVAGQGDVFLLQRSAVVNLAVRAAGHSDIAAGHVHREFAVRHRVVRVSGAHLHCLRALVNVRHGVRSGGPGGTTIQTVCDSKGI